LSVAVHDFLRTHRERILRSWETRVLREVRGVALEGLALRDQLPAFLIELADWLEGGTPPGQARLGRAALNHAIDRLDEGLDLEQVLHEYRLLRDTILSSVLESEDVERERAGSTEEHARTARVAELARLNAGLDVALSDSIVRFVRERDRRAAAVRDRIERTLRDSEQRHAFLIELADTLRPLSDPTEVQREAARVLGQRLGAARVHYADVVDDGRYAVVEAEYRVSDLVSVVGRHYLDTYGAAAMDEFRAGRMLVVPDVQGDARLGPGERAATARFGIGAYVVQPFLTDGKPVAILVAHHAGRRAWTAEELELVQETAERTQAAVERARAEHALRESEAKYRSLFDSIDQGFSIIEVLFEGSRPVDYRFLDVNPAFEAQTGIRDAIGRRMREIAPAHEEHWFETYGRVAVTREAVRFENDAHALGRYYEVYAFPVGTSEQRRVGILFRDITARRRSQEALLEADRRRTEFLAMLSHELRNPLAPIRNSLYLLEHARGETEQAARAREVLRRQTDHLTRLVDDLLDVTRITRGKAELRRERLDLRDLVRKTTDDLRSTFVASELALRVEQPAGPVWIDGDFTRLAQVLGNLLQNAGKFTGPGGAVTVRLGTEDGRATLSVRDTGAGMEPGEEHRMFEAFMQGGQDLARSRGGLGLGLALVKGLVEMHGGSVRARSEGPGRGSEFTVAFPLAEAPPSPPPREEARPEGTGRLVLLVEDNVDAGLTLADILELSGHRVRVAHDARSGLQLARALRPDVIVCDVGLPDMDGYAFARAARLDPVLGRTRLIALTGYAQPEDLERAREAGFDAHLPKPPPLEELEALIAGAARADGSETS
jgi:PAS domain S-box-containing protein